ncbi:MAG TPA: SOS response-associated peptidase [Acidimicrobiia bacterium]|nr:SOS response-associated peptidase [Acidimicrobiia bacterium]
MCGRFSLSAEVDFYADYFGTVPPDTEDLRASWNVAPTDPVYVVAEREHIRQIETMRWGLIPHWAKDSKSIHINARVETVATTAAFRESFAKRRCLIPADGFYEWEPKDKGRSPHWVFRADGYPVGFAGLWANRRNPADGEWVRSCTIITAPAKGLIASLHDRMPVALEPDAWESWLDRDATDPDLACQLLQPIDSDLWMERRVSKLVNSVRNNGPELQDPEQQGTLL